LKRCVASLEKLAENLWLNEARTETYWGDPRGPRISVCDVHRIGREQKLASQRRYTVGNGRVFRVALNRQAVIASAGALRASRRLRAFASSTVCCGHFANLPVLTLCQLSIAGELTSALSIIYTDNAVRHYWVSEAATWQSNKGSWVRRIEKSSIPARGGRAPIWIESVISIQGGSITKPMYTLKSNVGFNVRAMYGLAKHGHTLDFLDQCTDFESSHVYMA
jgi:hypothetical protein